MAASAKRSPNPRSKGADPVAALTTTRIDSFPAFLQALHASQYTGPLTLHCFLGVPQLAEFPAPPAPTTKIPLTRGQARRQGLTTAPAKPHSSR